MFPSQNPAKQQTPESYGESSFILNVWNYSGGENDIYAMKSKMFNRCETVSY